MFGTMMVALNDADGMVSGAMHTTADTIRPAMQVRGGGRDGGGASWSAAVVARICWMSCAQCGMSACTRRRHGVARTPSGAGHTQSPPHTLTHTLNLTPGAAHQQARVLHTRTHAHPLSLSLFLSFTHSLTLIQQVLRTNMLVSSIFFMCLPDKVCNCVCVRPCVRACYR